MKSVISKRSTFSYMICRRRQTMYAHIMLAVPRAAEVQRPLRQLVSTLSTRSDSAKGHLLRVGRTVPRKLGRRCSEYFALAGALKCCCKYVLRFHITKVKHSVKEKPQKTKQHRTFSVLLCLSCRERERVALREGTGCEACFGASSKTTRI